MQKLKVLKQRRSFSEAIECALAFKPTVVDNDERLFGNYAQVADRFAIVGAALERISRQVADHGFVVPQLPALSASAAALPRNETRELMLDNVRHVIAMLADELQSPKFGRVTWSDDESCRFTYCDVVRDCGILRNRIQRVLHEHDLVNARQHKLPAPDVVIPKQAQKVLRDIPEFLLPQVRIVTGRLVRKDERHDSSRDELTWLGQALDSGKRQARRAADAGFAGLSAAGRALSEAASSVSSSLNRAIAVADPAIVIGDVCFYGWEA